jgi:hypothetical protein
MPLRLICDAAQPLAPDAVLFPSVHTLVLVKVDITDYSVKYPDVRMDVGSTEFRCQRTRAPPHGVLMFDTIDVCVTGHTAATLLNVLPVRRYGSIVAHQFDLSTMPWVVSLGRQLEGGDTLFYALSHSSSPHQLASGIRILEGLTRLRGISMIRLVVWGSS